MAPKEPEENRERKRLKRNSCPLQNTSPTKTPHANFNFGASVYPDDSARVAQSGTYPLVFP